MWHRCGKELDQEVRTGECFEVEFEERKPYPMSSSKFGKDFVLEFVTMEDNEPPDDDEGGVVVCGCNAHLKQLMQGEMKPS